MQSKIGSEKLRQVRRERRDYNGKRLTIQKVAESAGYDYRILADIERGVTKRPSLEKLLKILASIDKFEPVFAEDKNAVLNAYGYESIFTIPSANEIEQACQSWQERYRYLKLPSYLVSFSQQLLDWNQYAPLILGLRHNAPELAAFRGITTFDLVFNPKFTANSRIENAQDFIPKLINTIKAEMQMFRYENWHKKLISQIGEKYPVFKPLWESLPDTLPSVDVRTHGPIHIRHPNGNLLKFQLVGIDFADDPRFRVVEYHPIDSTTLSEWISWIEQEET